MDAADGGVGDQAVAEGVFCGDTVRVAAAAAAAAAGLTCRADPAVACVVGARAPRRYADSMVRQGEDYLS
eukprot:COSAG06_NODE_137_length_22365_cov_49.346313_27_plen_70_part_00